MYVFWRGAWHQNAALKLAKPGGRFGNMGMNKVHRINREI